MANYNQIILAYYQKKIKKKQFCQEQSRLLSFWSDKPKVESGAAVTKIGVKGVFCKYHGDAFNQDHRRRRFGGGKGMATAAVEVIGVVGGGQMGSGIAQLAAVAGFDVWLHDTEPSALQRAQKSIVDSIRHLVSKGQISQVIVLSHLLCYPFGLFSTPFLVSNMWWNFVLFILTFLE